MVIKILFVGHNFHFINDLINLININYIADKFKVNSPLSSQQSKELKILINNYEYIFCEWFLDTAVYLSKIVNPKKQKLFIRLHRCEILRQHIYNAKWQNITNVIFVNNYVEKIVNKKVPQSIGKTNTIFNYINFPNIKNIQVNEDVKYNLCMVGYVPMLKRPDIAIEIYEKIKKIDPRFNIYFIGKDLDFVKKRKVDMEYYNKYFVDKKEINKLPFTNDLSSFYNEMGHILVCSDVESFHVSSHEALNYGIYPYYIGGCCSYLENIIPKEFQFNTIDSVVNKILENNKTFSKKKNKEKYQKYLDQFKLLEITNKILRLIRQ